MGPRLPTTHSLTHFRANEFAAEERGLTQTKGTHAVTGVATAEPPVAAAGDADGETDTTQQRQQRQQQQQQQQLRCCEEEEKSMIEMLLLL